MSSHHEQPENLWLRKVAENPGHSRWYIDRFRDLAAQGADLCGEARLIDAMVARRARILDAGCGTGRVGGCLARAGHVVVGVDLDPELVEAARADHPASGSDAAPPTWLVGDLSELDLPSVGVPAGFDVIVCAGNVMTFVAPSTRVEILQRFRHHLADDGRVVVGFGAGRGYDYDEFLADAAEVGLEPDLLLSSWDLRPFSADVEFLVAVLSARAVDPMRPPRG